MKTCSKCKKNIAVIFTSTMENGKPKMEGLCMECAKSMGIPVVDQLMQQTGMSKEDIDNLTDQMNVMFEGMDLEDPENNFLSNMFNGDMFKGGEGLDEPKEEFELDETKDTQEDEATDTDNKKKKKKKKKRKFLDQYGTNLTENAKNNLIDKVIGRNDEIDRIVQILNRRSKNNPILIGEPGVGKTAIAEGLAMRIVEKLVPAKLLDSEVYLLDLTAIVAGTQFRGQFEGRMKSILKEAKKSGNIILVIDEVHNIMGAGEVHGGVMNAANILKPALARGEIQVIGATTLEEYRKHIEKDSALERRFQPIIVDEPSVEESIEILKGIKGYYEDFHEVTIGDDVIEAAVKLSKRYITDRYLPDKAIDVIDEAGSKANLKNVSLLEIEEVNKKLEQLSVDKENAVMENDYEKAAIYKMEECKLIDELEQLKSHAKSEITVEDVAGVIELWTKIPVRRISEEEAEKLLRLEDRLHKRIIGQNKAVEGISRTIRRNRSGFRKRRKPASFIFVGPTGVGKTEVVRALSEEMFGSEDALIRIDMSEYMEKHTVSKLIGSPPGYVGYDEGGQLTEKVRRKPYSVILFDEIEKAHPDVFNMLLQILEDGRLTDSQGRTVFFENTIIIMTSNAGTNYKNAALGFGGSEEAALENRVRTALKQVFRPEFLNRIDDIIIFNKLTKDELRQIVRLMIKEVEEEMMEKDMKLSYGDDVVEYILDKGYDDKYGARPLRRTIQRSIEDEIAEYYLEKKIRDGDTIELSVKDDAVVINA
jgi:ATP-dependent Clp protease ATP-binding subunit ClpA